MNLEWNGYLCHRGDSGGSRGSDIDLSGYLIRDNLLGAVAGDVALLPTCETEDQWDRRDM